MSLNSSQKSQIPSERTKLKNIALFKDEDDGSTQKSSIQTLPIEKIITSPSQPRRYFDSDKMEQLIKSVKEHGILEPLLVRILIDDSYELVAGERRYRAAIAAGLTEVPVTIKQLTNVEALQIALIENLQREDLNPVEETEGILQLIAISHELQVDEVVSKLYRMYNEAKGNVSTFNPNVRVSEFDESVKALFDSLLGMTWESFVKNKLPLLKLPEDVLLSLKRGQLEYTKAKAIASVKDENQRGELLEEVITNALSLSQIRERVKALKPLEEKEELKNRLEVTYRQARKSKQLWQDPKKIKKLKNLLFELERLIESESEEIK